MFPYRKVTDNLRHIKGILQGHDLEDAAVAYLSALAGGKQLDVAPTSVKIVSQGDTVSEFEDRAVGFPHGNIHRGAAVKHSASGGNVYCF